MAVWTVAGVASLISALVGGMSAIRQGRVDRKNYEMALRNYESQQGLIDWNKHVQEQNWIREDTAVQRRVADLRAAGLNPVLAAGQGAPSTWHPVANHPTPPRLEHNSPQYLSMVGDALGKFAQVAQTRAQTKLLYRQAHNVDAQTRLADREGLHYEASAARQRVEAGLLLERSPHIIREHELTQRRKELENIFKDLQNSVARHDWNLLSGTGIRSNYRSYVAELNEIANFVRTIIEDNRATLESMSRGFSGFLESRTREMEEFIDDVTSNPLINREAGLEMWKETFRNDPLWGPIIRMFKGEPADWGRELRRRR